MGKEFIKLRDENGDELWVRKSDIISVSRYPSDVEGEPDWSDIFVRGDMKLWLISYPPEKLIEWIGGADDFTELVENDWPLHMSGSANLLLKKAIENGTVEFTMLDFMNWIGTGIQENAKRQLRSDIAELLNLSADLITKGGRKIGKARLVDVDIPSDFCAIPFNKVMTITWRKDAGKSFNIERCELTIPRDDPDPGEPKTRSVTIREFEKLMGVE